MSTYILDSFEENSMNQSKKEGKGNFRSFLYGAPIKGALIESY